MTGVIDDWRSHRRAAGIRPPEGQVIIEYILETGLPLHRNLSVPPHPSLLIEIPSWLLIYWEVLRPKAENYRRPPLVQPSGVGKIDFRAFYQRFQDLHPRKNASP